MRYRNTKTGQIVDVPSVLRGNWERIDNVKVPEKEPSFVSVPEIDEAIETEVKSAKKTRTTRKSKK